MRRILDQLIYQTPYAALWVATGTAILLSLLFLSARIWLPQELPQFFDSQAQLLGQVLLMTIMPTYILGLVVISQRRSMQRARKLHSRGVISDHPDLWLRSVPTGKLWLGLGIGLLYAIFANAPLEWAVRLAKLDLQEQSIVAGQTLLWMSCGFGLAFRFNTASLFDRQGQHVDIDIYNSSNLELFALNGVDDVLLITGAMGLTALQALDAQFRLGNYLSALIVALPAVAYLLIRPMWSLHRRLSIQKQDFLARMDDLIARQSDIGKPLPDLELLFQHRDRLQRAYTWPLDLTMVYRLLLYVVIPPLAWLGAALMETAVQGMLN